jgi:hypothetical protein
MRGFRPLIRWLSSTTCGLLLLSGATLSSGRPLVDDLVPQTPAAFLPGGMLGIQLGGSWKESKQNPSLHELACQATKDAADFDEVCFFRTSAASRVAGAEIHDGSSFGKTITSFWSVLVSPSRTRTILWQNPWCRRFIRK